MKKQIILTASTIEQARRSTREYILDRLPEQRSIFKQSTGKLWIAERTGGLYKLGDGANIQLPGLRIEETMVDGKTTYQSTPSHGYQVLGAVVDGQLSYWGYLIQAEDLRANGQRMSKSKEYAAIAKDWTHGAVLLYDIVQLGVANGILGPEMQWVAQSISSNIDKSKINAPIDGKNSWNGETTQVLRFKPQILFNGRGQANQSLGNFSMAFDDYSTTVVILEDSAYAFHGLGDSIMGNSDRQNTQLRPLAESNSDLRDEHLLLAYYKYTVAYQIDLKKAKQNPEFAAQLVLKDDGNLDLKEGAENHPLASGLLVVRQKIEDLRDILA